MSIVFSNSVLYSTTTSIDHNTKKHNLLISFNTSDSLNAPFLNDNCSFPLYLFFYFLSRQGSEWGSFRSGLVWPSAIWQAQFTFCKIDKTEQRLEEEQNRIEQRTGEKRPGDKARVYKDKGIQEDTRFRPSSVERNTQQEDGFFMSF